MNIPPIRCSCRLLGFAILCFLSNPIHAAVIAQDDFDSYTNGAALNGLTGGTGWASAGWDAKSGTTITSTESLTYLLNDGTVLGGGKALKAKAAADYLFLRRIATRITNGSNVFVSYIFKIESDAAADKDGMAIPESGNVFMAWQAIDSSMSGTVDTIGITGVNGKAAARVNNVTSYVSPVLRFAQTNLLVIKYIWDSSTSSYRSCQVWLNPTVADENTISPAITVKQTPTAGGSTSFDGLRVRTVGLATGGKYYLVDALRVGSTWTDVVAAPAGAIPDNSPKFVVFGDSLSSGGDDGTPLTSPAADPSTGGYPRQTWVQQLSELAGYGVLVNGYPQRAGGTNYAKSGDKTDAAGLTAQVNTYLADVASVSSPKNIFALWLGTNDVSAAVGTYKSQILSNPNGFITSVTNALPAAVDRMEVQIRRLIASGATQFFWVDLNNLGQTPLVDYYVDYYAGGDASARPTLAAAMEGASRSFNTRMAARVTALRAEFPGITIHTFGAWDCYAAVFANPGSYGFTNVTEGSLDSNDYFFRDRVHPTSHGHSVIAAAALDVVENDNILAKPVVTSIVVDRKPVVVGDAITIKGESFNTLGKVLIGGIEATIIAHTDSLIKVRLPTGSTAGAALTVITATGQTTANLPWKLSSATPPSVTGISPLGVHPGDSIAITGANLSGASVTIGGVVSTVTADGATSLTVTVPAGVLGANIAVVVTTDGGAVTAAQTLTITTLLQSWRYNRFSTYDPVGTAANTANPDNDTLINLLEYAFGQEPLVPNSSSPISLGKTVDTLRLALTFPRIADPDLTYLVQASNNLSDPASWQSIWSSTGSSNIAGSVTVPDTVTISSNPKRFLRLQVFHPESPAP